MHIRPPDVVVMGGACANCLAMDKNDLRLCTGCRRAWYCSKECQQQHWQGHKQICKAMSGPVAELIEAVKAAAPVADYSQLASILKGQAAAQMASKPLLPAELQMLLGAASCHECFRIREQLPSGSRMVCCPDCKWGWCCKEHWPQYQEAHQALCITYKRSTAAQLLIYRHTSDTGEYLTYCPEGSLQQMPNQLPDNWQEYFKWRQTPRFMDAFFVAASGPLSLPLMVVQGLMACYSPDQLLQLTELTVALVGASNYEVVSGSAMEEVLHLLPQVRTLHTALVGPDLEYLLSKEVDAAPMQMEACPACASISRKRLHSFYKGPFHEYAAGGDYVRPDIVVACNSGIHAEQRDSWRQSIKVMVEQKLPMVFTSYSQQEAADDAAFLREVGATITQGPELNRFASMLAHVDFPTGLDQFFHENAYWMCAR